MANASIQNSIIHGTVNLATAGISPVGFGRTLILGRNATFSGYYELFTSLADVLVDTGLTSTSPEYLAASFQFANGARDVGIGKIAARVAQVDTYTVGTAADGNWDWELTIDGTTYSGAVDATGLTNAQIATALRLDINTEAGDDVSATGSSTAVVVTSDVAGRGFTFSVTPATGGTGSLAHTTANVSVGDQLTLLSEENDSWFAICVVTAADEDIYQAAEWVAANPLKVQVSQSATSAILTSADTDIASLLQANGYYNSKVVYHATSNEYVAAGALANFLAVNQDTGTTTMNLTPVVGGTPEQITGAKRNYAIGKGAMLFLPSLNGGTTGGRILEQKSDSYKFFDDVVTRAWFQQRLEEQILRVMTQVRDVGQKIPQDDGGYTVLQNAVRAVYNVGVIAKKFVADTFVFTSAPDYATVVALYPSWLTDRRYEVTFQCSLAGAVGDFTFTANLIYGE